MTDTDRKINGQPEPWRRQVVWGRPPQQTFRAGPLPKGERLPPLPEPPREAPLTTRPASSIFSGSMIPQARPEPVTRSPSDEVSVLDDVIIEAPRTKRKSRKAAAAPVAETPLEAPVEAPVESDMVAAPVATRVEPEPAAPMVVSPTLIAASARRRAPNRLPLYVGGAVAVVALMAVGGFMLSRSTPPAAEATASPPANEPVAVVDAPATAPVPVVEAPAVAAAPATPVTASAPSRPTPSATRRSAASSQPQTTAPAPAAGSTPTPAPAIVTAPLVETPVQTTPSGPPPTEAERPSADPDAPVTTRPQPLN